MNFCQNIGVLTFAVHQNSCTVRCIMGLHLSHMLFGVELAFFIVEISRVLLHWRRWDSECYYFVRCGHLWYLIFPYACHYQNIVLRASFGILFDPLWNSNNNSSSLKALRSQQQQKLGPHPLPPACWREWPSWDPRLPLSWSGKSCCTTARPPTASQRATAVATTASQMTVS